MAEKLALSRMGRAPYVMTGALFLLFMLIAVAIGVSEMALAPKLLASSLFIILAVPPVALIWAQRRSEMIIDDDTVRISVPLYGRTFRLSDIDVASLRVASFADDPELRPSLRTNGVGLPGLSLGWHRLRNGRRAYLATTSRKVLCWRMHDGLWVLVGLADCDAALVRLKARISEGRAPQ